jgi:hypothetical protein
MKKSKKGTSWRELVTNKAIDLVIVVVGITIAYELNNIKESRDDRELERFYLENIAADLEKDIKEYGDNLAEFSNDRKFVHATLARMQNGIDVSDSIGIAVLNVASTKTFEGHNNTFSTVMGSNGLSVIENQEVRTMILEHYRLYASIERFEREHADLIARFHNHFTSAIDYNRIGLVLDGEKVNGTESKNLLTLAVVQLQSGIWRYEESLEKARELRARLVSAGS